MAEISISKYMNRFRRDTIYIRKTVTQKNSMGAILAQPSVTETELYCDIQPGDGSVLVTEYGERAKNMLAVFADPGVAVVQGDLARVYAADRADYRVENAQPWRGHTLIALEKM